MAQQYTRKNGSVFTALAALALVTALAFGTAMPRMAEAFTSDDLAVEDATVTFVLHFELVAGREVRTEPNGGTWSRPIVMGYLLPGDAPEEILSIVRKTKGEDMLEAAANDRGTEVNGRWVPLTSGHCYDIPTRVQYDADGQPKTIETLDLVDVTGVKDHTQYEELLDEPTRGADPEA